MEKDEMQIQVVKDNPWPKDGYMIDGVRTNPGDWEQPHDQVPRHPPGPPPVHHMFDGPFEVRIYHDHGQNPPVLALEVVCGMAIILTLNHPFAKRKRVDISGCLGASEGSEPIYVDARTSDQQVAMNALVREARREENLGPAGAGYEQARISISPNASANSTKIRATNSSSIVVVNRSIDGTGETHHTLTPCP